MKKEVKVKILKGIIIFVVLSLIIGLIMYLFPVIRNLSTKDGQVAFKTLVNNYGILGFLTLFGLQIAQVLIAVLPGEPLEVLAGMCYGSVWGTIFIMVTNFLITCVIFFLVRKYGKKFIYMFFKQKNVDKVLNAKIFNNTKKIETTMLILFFVPGTPKDMLIYVAGLLPIDPVRFMIISGVARFPSVISSTLVGSSLVLGKWQTGIIIYLVTFLFVGILLFLVNKFDKNKVIKSLKG